MSPGPALPVAALSAVVEMLPVALVLVDPQARVALVNLQAERLFGSARDELLGQSVEQLFPEGLGAPGPSVPGADSRRDLVARRRDGQEIRVELTLSQLVTEAGTFVCAGVRDLGDHRRREQELARAAHLLRATREFAGDERAGGELERARGPRRAWPGWRAREELFTSLAHELRTPLAAILGFTELSHRDRRDPLAAHQERRLLRVLEAGDRLRRLIDDVLEGSVQERRRPPLWLLPVPAADLLAEVRAALGPDAARAGVGLVADTAPPDLPPVLADRAALREILLLYGRRVIESAEPGGVVCLSARRDGERVRLVVRGDTRSIADAGAALAAAGRLALDMDGMVGQSRAAGLRAELWVALSPTLALPVQPAPGEAGGGPVLFYIDADGSHVALMAELIDEVGRGRLLAAMTLGHGIAAARAARADLLIIDLDEPGMVERDPAALVRQAWPRERIPVVGVSGPGALRAHPRRLLAGFDRLLHRPVGADDLARVLDDLVP